MPKSKHRFALCIPIGMAMVTMSCVHYASQPVDPTESSRAFQSRKLGDPDVIEAVASVLPPEEATGVHAGVWGQSALLVAAMRMNPKLAEARAHVKEMTNAVVTANSLPNVTVGLGGEYNLSQAAESPWLWSISTDFLLDAVLQRNLRDELAQTQVRGARLDYAEAIWAVRKEVRTSLLAAVLAEKREAVLAAAEQDREQLAQMIRRRHAVGEASATEQLQVELEASRSRAARIGAHRDATAARAQLANAVGLPVAALDGVRLQWTDLQLPVLPSDARLDELRQQALLSRSDLERAIADYQSRETELHQQIRAQYPQMSIGPGYMWDHGIRKATLGMSFSMPMFSRNRGPIGEAEAKRAAAGEHLLLVQATAINEIDAAQRAYRDALETLAAAVEQTAATKSLAASTARAVGLGSEDRVALATARVAASTDELALIDAIERMQQALGQWEDAVRTPLTGSEINLRLTTDALH
jgi:outer membrane protein TolC